MKQYYVYQLIDHRTGQPFYVGKGSGDRKDKHVQLVRLGRSTENRYKDKIIRDIYSETGRYPESVIVSEFDDEIQAYNYETLLIEKYGIYKEGGILSNILKDSKPPSAKGKKRTDETRKKLSNAKVGDKNPMYGKTISVSTKEKWKSRKNFFLGKFGSEHPITGYTHSDKECETRSLRQKEQWKNEEYSKKIIKNLDRSKSWKITTPYGEELSVYNLKEYSDKVKVPYHVIRRSKKGWICQ